MTSNSVSTTVVSSIVVAAPIETAFQVFTDDFGRFKPPEHNILGGELAETVFEPRVGGHIYDRGVDGRECRWARVLAFDPPRRLLLTWNISPTWQIEEDPARASEWEVRFESEGPDRTRVVIEHRHLDRHGEGWQSVSDAIGSQGGWPLYLSRYADVIGRWG
jgi:uncharacterized protein YndB with AHSA1/START domain